MPVAHSSAVYYPHIDVRNDAWLKKAAIYWDELKTIVPEDRDDPYKTETSRRLNEAGFLTPLRVTGDSRIVSDLAPVAIDFLSTDAGQRALKQSSPTDIDSGKIAPQLLDFLRANLEARGNTLELLTTERGPKRLLLGTGFVELYMCQLAVRASKTIGYTTITDTPRWLNVATSVEAFGSSHSADHGPNTDALAARLLVDYVSVGNATVESIIEYRERSRVERGAFRRALVELCEGLEGETPEAINQRLTDVYNQSVLPSLKEIERSLKDSKVTFARNSLFGATSFVSGLTGFLSGFPLLAAGSVAGAGLYITSEVVALQREQARISAQPLSYLLTTQAALRSSPRTKRAPARGKRRQR